MSKSAAKTENKNVNKTVNKNVNKNVNKDVNKDVDTIFYYNRKIETYKNRIKWLRKQISALNQKIKIYTECQEDFYNSMLSKARKKPTETVNKAVNKEENKTDNSAENTENGQ